MSKKYSYWLHSDMFSMLQKLSMVLFGLATFMILARIFDSPAKFGVWGIFIVISSIVEMLRHALVKNGYILFINTCAEEEKPGIEYAAFLCNCLFSIVLIIFFLTTGNWFERFLRAEGLGIILRYYSFTLIFLLAFSHQEFRMIARSDFKGMFFLYFFRNGVFMLITTFFFISGISITLQALAIYYGVSAITGLAVGLLIGKKYYPFKLSWNKQLFYRFVNYGKYILGTNFFALLFKNTDTFMVARLISPAGVAFYNVSTRIINFAEMPVLVLSETMLPRAAGIVKSGDLSGMKNIYEKTVAAMLTFTIPFIVFISIFARQVILLIAGAQYVDATRILQLTVFFSLFIPFTSQFGNIMDSTGRPQVNLVVMMIFAAVNVVANYIGLVNFGLPGSAYGTLGSYVLLLITTQIILSKLVGVSQMQILRNIFILYGEYYKLGRGMIFRYVKS